MVIVQNKKNCFISFDLSLRYCYLILCSYFLISQRMGKSKTYLLHNDFTEAPLSKHFKTYFASKLSDTHFPLLRIKSYSLSSFFFFGQ